MIQHAGFFGATGIEIDVRSTRDNKIIVFHDNTFSPRTIQGTYLLGPVKNFDLEHIRSLGRLILGEQIPTLSEALKVVIEDTDLSLVWLDVKDPTALDQTITIQKEAMDYAAARGRTNLDILMGISADEEVQTAYKKNKNPFRFSVHFLSEDDDDELLSMPNCRAYAPYWTEHLSPERIRQLQNAGKLILIWTVDLRDKIREYLNRVDGRVDGILTNYPSLARGIHDSRE
jgi:glycerophosphoryl diester phosphodiesterase